MLEVPKRQLGMNGPWVPSLGFGCMGLSQAYGKIDDDEKRFEILDRAVALGATFWDTSDAYSDNEELLGKWFARSGKRSEIFLCTKFGVDIRSSPPIFRSDPEYVRTACERSLKRLGVDKIDLWFTHRLDLKTPIEKTIQAMVELKKEGKIEHIGLSEISATTLRRAHKIHPIAAVQLEYSPFSLEIERPDIGLLDACRKLGVALVAYSPLGRGFLTGQLKSPDDFEEGDFRKTAPKYSKENWSNNVQLVKLLQEMARNKGCSPGQLSLAWIMSQGNDIIPIPGTKKIKYLEENMASLQVQLTEGEKERIRTQVEKVELKGSRYNAFFSPYSFADTPVLES